MKKGKKKDKVASKVEVSVKKVKVGDLFLYLTEFTVDKAEVISIDKDKDIAILSNRIQISTFLSTNGLAKRVGSFDTNKWCSIKAWSDQVDDEFNYYTSLRGIPKILDDIKGSIKSLKKEDVIAIHRKLSKISKNFL